MPDGKTHTKIWKAGLVGVPVVTLGITLMAWPNIHVQSGWVYLGAGIPTGYLFGLFVDPDLDIVGMSKSEGRMMNIFPIVGNIMVGYWTIYGAFFRRHHRSFWTHGPFVSTAIRYLFAFWWVAFLDNWWNVFLTLFFVGMYFGTVYADVLHWAADTITKEIK